MQEKKFELVSSYTPQGDQPSAIKTLVDGIQKGEKHQTLLGATGTGKTFTMANIITETNKPTLIMAHNKTLAAQLYEEFKAFFPHNAVEYFVSYYDYFQPEAYIPHTDTFIEKDSSINDEIDKLRHSATSALLERRDVIVISSVSCIYGLGNPTEYGKHVFSIRNGMELGRDDFLRKLVELQYERNDIEFKRASFRVRGDIVEIIPASRNEQSIRVEFFGDEIDRISEVEIVSGKTISTREHVALFPASHFVTSGDLLKEAMIRIQEELIEQLTQFKKEGKFLEAQRIEQRTNYDLEMLEEMGFCSGIENYSRHLEGRPAGSMPSTLIDYFPEDFLCIIDESHATVPQIGAMFGGDKSRKQNLVDYGFRLPSAKDNRPLTFDEFQTKVHQTLYVSATPGNFEKEKSDIVAEQIIRPTGLLDPVIDIRPTKGQIDDLLDEIQKTVEKEERVLITTLTKKMAEDLSDYLKEAGVKVRYLHSDIKTLERSEILRDLRLGVFDVLIGINLLREGLDLPEVSLVTILDADKEGFLRSERSLIQTIGRAARNEKGRVIMYADKITRSMDIAIGETKRRRALQHAFNEKHGITPTTIRKHVRDTVHATKIVEEEKTKGKKLTKKEKEKQITLLQKEMQQAAKTLDFERAAELRDLIHEISK